MSRFRLISFLFGLWIIGLITPLRAQFVDIGASLPGVGDAAVAWADYDSDGDLDFVIAGVSASGAVTLLYQNINGGFALVSNTPFIGISLGALAWGDYDNDNDVDLLLTGQRTDGSPTTQLYRNDNGSFIDTNAGILALKAGSADWGDFDNDGDLDFVISGLGVDNVTTTELYRQSSSGSFAKVTTELKGLRRGDLGWIDYDRDGDLDLLISGRDTGNQRWTIVYDNINGQLIESGYVLPKLDLSTLSWGDYGNLGVRRLFMSGTSDSGITAKIFDAPIWDYQDSFEEIDIEVEGVEFGSGAWGSYNNTMDAELALMGRNEAGTPITRIYDYDETNRAFEPINAGIIGLYKGDLAWGDYDGDKNLDLLIAGYDANDVPVTRIYRNTTTTVNTVPHPPFNLWAAKEEGKMLLHWSGALNEWNKAYKLTYNVRLGTTPGGSEIISPQSLPDGSLLLPKSGNLGDGFVRRLSELSPGTYYWSIQSIDHAYTGSSFTPDQIFEVGDHTFVDSGIEISAVDAHAFWGDLDGDGDLDVITDDEIYENQNGAFVALQSGVTNARKLSDIDNDGDLDILAFSVNGTTALYINDNLTFTKSFPFEEDDFTAYTFSKNAANFGDFDNDGDEDIVFISYSKKGHADYGTIRLYLNDNGSFESVSTGWGTAPTNGESAVADYDNDGDKDVYVLGLENYFFKSASATLHHNTGGSFDDLFTGIPAVFNGTPAWGDFDNDGDLDLAQSGTIYGAESPGINGDRGGVFRNEGDSFLPAAEILPASRFACAAWGDYDNDGDLDLLLAGSGNSPLYENRNGQFVHITGAFDNPENLQTVNAVWGDYDNDSDLDVLISARDEDWNPHIRIFTNTRNVINEAPLPPQLLAASVSGSSVSLSWERSSDKETPALGLSYNLIVGTAPGKGDVMAAPAVESGILKMPELGNVNQNTSWTIHTLDPGVYYWSVQSIDTGFKGSAFSEEGSFVITDITIPVELITFAGKIDDDTVVLSWQTLSEINNAGFEIQIDSDQPATQESSDNEILPVAGASWSKLAFVPGAGTTTQPQSYIHHISDLPPGTHRFRLKQIDFDGGFEFVAQTELTLMPAVTTLLPNFPNPFNPSTLIRYDLSTGAFVNLTVYDMSGRKVALLVNRFKEAGRHKVVFESSALPSGVYIYRLETPTRVIHKQMILLK